MARPQERSDKYLPLTSRISRTSHAVSRASSFSWAVPRTRSFLNSPLCVRGGTGWAIPRAAPPPPEPRQHPWPSLPFVDHFELDAFGLDGPSEATVTTVDAELELLLELCVGKVGGRREGVRLQSQVLSAGGSLRPRLTRGVCALDHAGLVFLSFFLAPDRRHKSSGHGAHPQTPAGPTPRPDRASVGPFSALHVPRWDRGSRTEQRHPGHQGTALRANKGQNWAEGVVPKVPPPAQQPPSPWGVGRLMPFTMNRSMSLLLRSGKILPGGQGEDRVTSAALPASAPSLPLSRESMTPAPGLLAVSQLLGLAFRSRLEFSIQVNH